MAPLWKEAEAKLRADRSPGPGLDGAIADSDELKLNPKKRPLIRPSPQKNVFRAASRHANIRRPMSFALLPSVWADPMPEALVRPSLKNSWAYQYRMQVTAVVMGAAWAYVALSRPWFDQGSTIDWLIDGAAWTAFLGGALLRLWATLWIAGRKKQKLVDDGPYRACRNPLYLGTFAMGIGIGLFLKSLVFAAGLGLVLSLYLWFVVPAEERYMRSRFADDYDEYCAPSSPLVSAGSACSVATRSSIRPPIAGRFTANAGEWPAGCCSPHWPS